MEKELQRKIDLLYRQVSCIKKEIDVLQQTVDLHDSELSSCNLTDDCIKDKYVGPGLRFLAYDGATISFQDVAAGTAYPTVTNFAALPAPGSVAPPNNIYVVVNSTGVWFINRKERGIYYSDGIAWTRLGDVTTIFVDDVFQIQDNSDPTKILKFTVDSITGTATKTFQSGNGTIAELTDIPTYTTVPVNFAMSPYNIAASFGTYVFLIDSSSGNVEINVPTAVGNDAILIFKKISSDANYIDVNPDGVEQIDNDTTHRILFQNTAFGIRSDNTQWWNII